MKMLMLKNSVLSVLLMVSTMVVIAQENNPDEGAERTVLYWVAPMDPNYRRDKPGQSPMGMDLTPIYADEVDASPGISVSAEVIQTLGIRTAIVERSRLWRLIRTVGYIQFDEDELSHVHLRTAGWVEELAIKAEGEEVSKGQFLFSVYSPELVNVQEEFVQALRGGNKKLISASRDRLASLGVDKTQINALNDTRKVRQKINYYASQAGVISSLPVKQGMYVMPSKRVMTLIDISRVWLIADVFESQSRWVSEGDPVDVDLGYLHDETIDAEVDYIYPELDKKSHTLRVRIKLDNRDKKLRPGMFAKVKIYSGPKSNILVVPTEAVIKGGESNRVILRMEEGRFDAKEVGLGMESGGFSEIIYGLAEGDKVVVSGQFLLDSEASLKASFMRMGVEENHSEGPESISLGNTP